MALLISEVVNAQLGESSGGKAAPPRVIGVTGIFLQSYHVLVAVGDTIPVSVGFIPANASNKSYEVFDESNGTLIETDSTGRLIAKAAGSTTLTFKSKDGGYEAHMVVDIKQSLIQIDTITINEPAKDLHINDEYKLSASWTPANAEAVDIVWGSSDETVATVDDKGNVIAWSLGTVTISVVAPNPNKDVSASLVLNVVEPPQKVTGVDITIDKSSIISNQTAKVTVDVKPANAANKDYTLTVTPAGSATVVKSTGIVTPAIDTDGDVTITVKTVDGNFTDSVVLHVDRYVAVTGVTIKDGATLQMYPQGTHTLDVEVAPANASDDSIKYTSSDAATVKVDADGKLTALKTGSATITAASVDKPAVKDTITVTVVPDPSVLTGIDLSGNNVTGAAGVYELGSLPSDGSGAVTVTMAPLPATATLGNVVATVQSGSDNIESIVVDNTLHTFVVTGKAVGDAVIKLTAGTVSSTLTVHVIQGSVAVTGVEISDGDTISVDLSAGTKQLTAVVKPANATNKAVTWSSSDQAVATVTNTGLVTVLKGGSATLTVTTTQGGFTDNIALTVVDDVNKPLTALTLLESPTTAVDWDGTNTFQMNVQYDPTDTTEKGVTWSSSDETVMTVSATGVLTFKKMGQATITVTSTAHSTIKASAVITMTDKRAVDITTPTISDKTYYVGGTYPALQLIKDPADGVVTGTWDTTDHAVATIDPQTGVLTPVAAGTFGISFTGTDGSGAAVTDNSGGGTVKDVESINITTPSLYDLTVGGTAQMGYTLNDDAVKSDPNFKVKYTTSDAGTISVDADTGIMTGVANTGTRTSIGVDPYIGTVKGSNGDSSGTYCVDALTSFAAELPTTPPTGVTLVGNVLTFDSLAAHKTDGVVLTLVPTPSSSSVGFISVSSAAVSKVTVTDPKPFPDSQGDTHTIVVKPVAVDTAGTKVTITSAGKTLELTVKTSAA